MKRKPKKESGEATISNVNKEMAKSHMAENELSELLGGLEETPLKLMETKWQVE